MIVCHCMAVNDRQVRDEIAAGAKDAFDIADACDAGTVCGGCVPTICELLQEARCGTGVAARARRLVGVGARQ